MRPRQYVPVFLLILPVILIIGRIRAFRQIFYEHAGIAMTQDEIALAYNSTTTLDGNDHGRKKMIPKIMHQIFHNWNQPGNDTLPHDWDSMHAGCKANNPNWDVKLWTQNSSRDFIKEQYPWFLKTYDGYKYPVQRVDTVKYFLLLHYGGIYLDLDNGCKQDLSPLLYYPTWATDGGRGALYNNILGSVPNHPFWAMLTNSLKSYNYNYIFPYITISYASGQWFETDMWQRYHALVDRATKEELIDSGGVPIEGRDMRLHRVMMDDREGRMDGWVFFTRGRGSSWVNWDNRMFWWIGEHEKVLAFGMVGFLGLFLWGVRKCSKRRDGYVQLKEKEDDV